MMNGVMEAVTPYQLNQALNEENAVFSVGKNAMQSTDAKQSKPFVASHYRAYRIQRAWRLHKWRTNFKKYGENRGWVGTLDWLQKHKLLYGTELAEPEDVSNWEKARRDAPLDSVVVKVSSIFPLLPHWDFWNNWDKQTNRRGAKRPP